MIDTHVHYTEKYPAICPAIIFPPCEEIYERDNKNFIDTNEWKKRRQKANEKNLGIDRTIPYLFLWTDFNITNIEKYSGIKIHRHSNEPKYNWSTPHGQRTLQCIKNLNFPVLIEDDPENTVLFIKMAKDINIIIPHLYNYHILKNHNVFNLKNIFVDTSAASPELIVEYIKTYGCERMLFASDWPYSTPTAELFKILKLPIDLKSKKQILNENVKKIIYIEE